MVALELADIMAYVGPSPLHFRLKFAVVTIFQENVLCNIVWKKYILVLLNLLLLRLL